MSETWLWMTAAELGRGIEAGTIDPRDLTEAYLGAAAAHRDTARIFTHPMPERARAEAAAAAERAKLGLRRSPLDGVPVSWKDLFDAVGAPCEAGSALLKDRRPERDAEVLRVATAEGLICLGKTHMSELAFSGLGLNPVTATPPCVNDAEAVPGGSSSGAAASVAHGIAAAGVGSDTGGSARVPAAWNDLVGLKTTSGRLPLEGVVPLCARFDTVGPLTRSVEDAALLLAAMEGRKASDLSGVALSGARLAVFRSPSVEELRETPADAFGSALARLERAGATVSDLNFPEFERAMDLTGVLYPSEAYGIWRETIEAAPHLMFAEILARFRGGADVLASDYVAAWRTVDAVRAAYAEASSGFDAVLIPTAPTLPPSRKRLLEDEDYYKTENLYALRNTRVGNLLGLCAVTLPTGVPSCGISLMAGPMEEERLLRLSAAAERALA
ncbi:MAG: amidase [Pseudomonadota bacterium]